MEIKYFVGIDFGHGETTVSRAPGYNGNRVSQIALRNTNNNESKKILSSVCKRNGDWSLVYGVGDFKSDDIREGFKGMICNLSDKDKESLCEFAKLIFQTILDNDNDLVFKSSEEKNFKLGIACPSGWVRDNENSVQEYVQFFREYCGIPVDHCIKESDAAFFTKFKHGGNPDGYQVDDSVFVIDIGSSTIDFTTYSNSKCIKECCWGDNFGAHKIEDTLLPYIIGDDNNRRNIQRVEEHRRKKKKEEIKRNNQDIEAHKEEIDNYANVDGAISLFVRNAKEKYYSENQATFLMNTPFNELTSEWAGNLWENCIVFSASQEEYENIIKNYTDSICNTLVNAKIRLSQNDISLNGILLSGGACRMPFIRRFAEDIFEVRVDVDPQPECVVSNGIALYSKAIEEAYNKLVEQLGTINFEDIYIKADTNATVETIKGLISNVVENIKNGIDCSADDIRTMFCDFIQSLGPYNNSFCSEVKSQLKSEINSAVGKAISSTIFDVFKIEIDTTDIDIDIDPQILSFSDDNFVPGGGWYNNLTQWIVDATVWLGISFVIDWDKSRDYNERRKIANRTKSSLISFISKGDFVAYPDLSNISDNIRRQTLNYALDVFKERQLFDATFKDSHLE